MIQAILPVWLIVIGWVAVGFLMLGAWVLAALLVGPGAAALPRSQGQAAPPSASDRFGRAAMAAGPATVATLALIVVFRGLASLTASLSGGPFQWFDSLLNAIVGLPVAGQIRGAPADVALWLAFLDVGVLAVLWAVFAWKSRRASIGAYRVPHAGLVALVLLGGAVVLLAGTATPWSLLGRGAILLDFIVALPVALGALALWTRAHADPPPALPPSAPTQQLGPAAADAAAIWRQHGVIAPDARPLFSTAGNPGIPTRGLDAEVWRVAGGLGPPPAALESIHPRETPFQGSLVGDLPDPTDQLLVTAWLVRALQHEGLVCLVVTDDVTQDTSGRMRSALRDSVERAILTSGSWQCGPLVVGERELREAIAGQRFPAAAFLSVGDLSSQGIRTFGRTAAGSGAVWASSIGLVVIPRIDRGTPLNVTHRMFTLRRLTLALHAAGARWAVLATGFGGPTTRALVEQSFSGIAVRDVPLGPRASAPVQVWTPSPKFVAAAGLPWVRRAAEPLVRSGLRVSVGDPRGSFDLPTLEVEVGKVTLLRDVALDGDASASQLDEAWFLASLRALQNRVPLPEGRTHHAVWNADDGPVFRFLTRPGTMEWLAYESRMPAPRPLVGYQNRLLARAHLNAALREGEQDIESLSGLFGRSLVDQAVGPEYVPSRWAFRTVPGRTGVSRVPLVPALAGEITDPLRDTVTDSTVRVVDRNGGRLLLEVDRVVAETRFYPHRIFAVGTRRYEVQMHAFDDKRSEIQADLVDAARPLTRPLLSVELSHPDLTEAPHEVVSGKLAFGLAAYEATAVETVSGVVQADGKITTYAPVSSQYRTRVRVISFRGRLPRHTHAHLAHSMGSAIAPHLLTGAEEVVVIPLSESFVAESAPTSSKRFHEDHPTSVAVLDRFVQGMGVVNALDAPFVEELMSWVRAILAGCTCADGCRECCPPEVLKDKPDKAGVLKLLGV